MKKTVKKLDNNVIKALTLACETAKDKVPGFSWLTHTASYDRFPGSLMVTCVFDTDEQLKQACEQEHDRYIRKLIQGHLLKVGVVLKDVRQHVFFDTEQQCELQHGGDWDTRINNKTLH
ncbi:Fis family transcriptional regulator [Neptunicella sp. SCSIO 80796]|uniref:Fis family transcriptional regulator n=1 Tax=Neptunicella plasticusilytica TaxID=3117012 RepID=UPI003A4E2820